MKSYANAEPILRPCGHCMECLKAQRGEVAMRAVHEASLYAANCFMTLTFNEENLPADLSLSRDVLNKMFDRFRYFVGPFRYLACGEYGERNGRPHYHACIFGHDFSADRTPWRKGEFGMAYRSPLLEEKIWPFGFSEVSDFSFATAGYVASYIGKGGSKTVKEAALQRINPLTGEMWQVEPEFRCMSLKPGLGMRWFERYRSDCFPSDFLIKDGQRVRVPTYYLRQLQKEADAGNQDSARMIADIKRRRREVAMSNPEEQSTRRLMTKHEIGEMKLAKLHRPLDEMS